MGQTRYFFEKRCVINVCKVNACPCFFWQGLNPNERGFEIRFDILLDCLFIFTGEVVKVYIWEVNTTSFVKITFDIP